MARPLKPKELRKDTDLRISVTASQKAVVTKACETLQVDMASWARGILVKEAQAVVDNENAKKPKKRRPDPSGGL